MKQTTNYNLNKPELTDVPDITTLNPNFDKIDTELKAHQDELDNAVFKVNGKSPDDTGNVSITDIDGNAETATKLANARTISLTGDVTGSVSFDGSTNKSVSTAVKQNPTFKWTVGNTLGVQMRQSGGTGEQDLSLVTYTDDTFATTKVFHTLINKNGDFLPNHGSTLGLSGTSLSLKNKSGTSVSSVTLPTGTSSALGLVKIGSNITVSSGTISVSKSNVTSALGYTPLQTAPVTSVNGKTGAVTLDFASTTHTHNYLPLGGGVMTSATAMTRNVDNDRLFLCGGTGASNGAYIRLSGKSETNYNGAFVIQAHDGTNQKLLRGNADGTLLWATRNVLTEANTKAYVTTTWKSGNNWYRVWSDGWIEQGGLTSTMSHKSKLTLNKAFSDKTYTFVATADFDSYSWTYINTYERTTSSTMLSIVRTGDGHSSRVSWYACGF